MLAMDLVIAARSLARHTRRNALLGGAIAAVTALLVLLGALTAGVRATVLESGTTLMSGHVNVGGFFKPTSGTASPLVVEYEKVLAAVRKEVPEVAWVSARGRGYAKAVSGRSSLDVILGGVDIDAEPGFRRVVRLSQGTFEALREPDTILLFEEQRERLRVDIGDVVTLSAATARGVNNTIDLRVAAIAKKVGLLSTMNAFVPNEALRRLYQLKSGSAGALHLYLHDETASPQIAARLRTSLAAAGWRVMDPDPQPYWMKLMRKVTSENWTGQKLDVTTWEDELSFITSILSALKALTGLLVGILLVIVIVGLMNNMWIAIRERTKEIGTLRAIGMQRRKVAWLFLLEALLLSLVGAALGLGLGAGLAAGLDALAIPVPAGAEMFLMTDKLVLLVQPGAALRQLLLIVFVTTLAALMPAVRAARLQPVTAMHHAG